MSYPWPGNVRELAAWAERLYATGLEAEVLAEMLLIEAGPQRRVGHAGIAEFGPGRTAGDCPGDGPRRLQPAQGPPDCSKVHRATLARKLKKHRLT